MPRPSRKQRISGSADQPISGRKPRRGSLRWYQDLWAEELGESRASRMLAELAYENARLRRRVEDLEIAADELGQDLEGETARIEHVRQWIDIVSRRFSAVGGADPFAARPPKRDDRPN